MTGDHQQDKGGATPLERERFIPPMQEVPIILRRFFLNRTDVLCFDAAWGSPCPVRVDPAKLDDALRAHVHGKRAASVIAGTWTTKNGKTCSPHPYCRLGAYFPGTDNRVNCAVTDCDGGAGHASPLANPLATAVEIQTVLRAYGLPNYLERSRSLGGWHNWLFLAERVDAALVRRVLLCLLSTVGGELSNGGVAAVGADGGPELFPKADSLGSDPNAVGSQVWLPWYHDSKPGGGLFYRVIGDGEAEPYLPDAFECVTLATLQQLDPLRSETNFEDIKDIKDVSPFVDFNRRGWGWGQLLGDWKEISGGRWRRPGKSEGISATTGFIRGNDGTERLYCFSTSTKLQSRKCYSKAEVYSILFHHGDWSAAAKALRQLGFGAQNRGTTRPEEEPWQQPAPLTVSPALPPFPLEILPPVFRTWAEAIARSLQVPADFPAMLALGIAGAGMARKIRVRVRGDWFEPLNLYVIAALPSGDRKSACFRAALEPVAELEREQREAMAPDVAVSESEIRQLEALLKRLEAEVAKEKDASKKRAIKEEAARVARELKATTPLVAPLFYVDDDTPECLCHTLVKQGGRLLIAAAEGTIFENMLGKYSGTPSIDVFLKGHAGDDVRSGRVMRGREFIDHAALSMAVCVQPGVLQSLGEHQLLRYKGMLGRNLYSLPDSRVGTRQIAPPSVPLAAKRAYGLALRDLWLTNYACTPDGKDTSHVLEFSVEAEQVIRSFEQWLEPQLGPGGDLAALAGWGNKLAGAVARIAGILHVADAVGRNEEWRGPIAADTVRKAATLARCYLVPHAVAVFALMAEDENIVDARRVLGWIAEHPDKTTPSMTRADVFQGLRRNTRFTTPESLDRPLQLLEQHGYVRRLDRSQGGFGRGRPTERYLVNPLWDRGVYPKNPKYPDKSPEEGIFKDIKDFKDIPPASENEFEEGEL